MEKQEFKSGDLVCLREGMGGATLVVRRIKGNKVECYYRATGQEIIIYANELKIAD